MQPNIFKAALVRAGLAASIFLLGSGAAYAQQQVNLTAGPANASMPDGSTVPMWGYSCGAAVSGSTATCAPLNPNAGTGWSPVVITVPTGATGGLTINLTNNLSFTPAGATTPNGIPTSITIVGQVGGGLGAIAQRTTTPSPTHGSQSVTWTTANTGPTNVPPPQGPRVQSFATEVAAGSTTLLPAWPLLKPGTYLLESGTHPSIQGPMGLYGILVVTAAPTVTTTTAPITEAAPGCAYGLNATAGTCAIPYDAEVPMLLSEIDPVQNTTVNAAVNSAGFSETAVWSGQPGGCGNPSSATYLTCYPPAVNYTPLYYMVNGVAFNKNNTSASLFAVTPATIAPATGTGNVLVRIVNAGLRMHVPSIVGSQVAGATGGSNPIVTGFKVIAEDGNPLPGVPKIRSEVFMAAGKVYDVMINGEATSGTTIASYTNAPALFDRELSLSANATGRDSGMLAYIGINGAKPPVATGTAAIATAAVANADNYALVPGQILTVSDPSKGVLANDKGVYIATLLAAPTNGSVSLNSNGTFVYYPTTGSTATTDTFTYCANGHVTGTTCSSGITATVTLAPSTVADLGITCSAAPAFTSTMATYLAVKTPGVLAFCKDAANLPLTVKSTVTAPTGMTVLADLNGGFTAIAPAAGTYPLTFTVQNPEQQTATVTVNVIFPAGSGLTVNVLDGYDKTTQITDYRWIIEEDRTFFVDPNCSANPPPAGCPTVGLGIVPTLGTNFHTSHMPFVAQGCTGPLSCEGGQTAVNPATGAHVQVVCDVGNGQCRPDPTGNGMTAVMPGAVALDPTKRYYISIFPGDAATPFISGYAGAPNCAGTTTMTAGPNSGKTYQNCGHGMGGAPIKPGQIAVSVLTQPSPYPPGKLSVFVFEDDFPLNGEQDGGGGVDVLSPNEPGLGGFQIHLWDAMGGNGDFTGQMTYDMFNQPLTNSLAGTIDPVTNKDACPIGVNELSATSGASPTTLSTDPTATGITGMIVTCPKYESDNITLSPLAGQAVIANLMPGRWGVIATPAADRIARGEEWLQTNTLDGQKAHDVFTRIGEPSYFQEFGPASYHVSIGFANPAIINARHAYICNGTDPNSPQPGTPYICNNTITGKVTGEHLSRTPDERLYSTGSHDTYYWTQCYVSFGDPDGEDFAFTKCNGDGTFTLSGLPAGDWRVTVFDQWNDGLVDGLSTPVGITGGTATTGQTINMGDIATTQWETNLYTRTFVDDNKDGISQSGETGIPFANVAVRLRDGSLENLLVTDFTGTANFNETFPLFSWYVVETDVTRYKNTGTHVVYDVGGPVDGSASCGTVGYPPCGTSTIGKYLANTAEIVSVPANLRVPGSVYCAGADCTGKSIQNGPSSSDPPSACQAGTATVNGVSVPTTTCTQQLSSGRIDNPWTGGVEGWQGFPGQNNFLEFGKEPYIAGENGGIKGHVVYASTRPFDDPMMLVQTQWTPLVPNVTMNLYKEGVASDGVTPTLTLVDTTTTSSWDDYAQGFRADGVTPNMNCPGQGSNSGAIADLFFYSLYDQPNYLSFYNSQHGGPAVTMLPNNSQFKCYDGMHNWNQIQPAPYDGMYRFPSVTAFDTNGKPTATYNTSGIAISGTNCSICVADPVPSPDLYAGVPMLPPGKYVVEVVLPPGYELVKEEDKNILIGDNFIAPVTQEFGGLGNIFIIPDQASVAASYPGPGYNANNPQDPTVSLGTVPQEGIVPGFIPEPVWPCVGEMRIVPDYMSIFPQSKQVAPFAGATRPLCDRKEVTLGDQSHAIAKFYIYTSTHIASKFTGGITDDYTSEFDPFSPQFGEKFAPPNLPVAVKDWAGNEISRVYADHWGSYDGMTYSTWEVNPPNPTGYSPTMMVFCMNDPGPIPGPGGTMITDPAYAPGYSQFCYELPFMPGTTQYLDTPVVPTSAFAGAGYNNVDCAYPDATPAIAEVDGDQIGPWVSAAGKTLTITALGNQTVPNYAYTGPSATTAPFNEKTITRHYGFGTTQGTGGVTIGGVSAPVTGWSDTSITVTVPSGIPNCPVQQQAQYGGATAQCGQLVITATNGKQSIDAITVTVGGKAPTHVAASGMIQDAIDLAAPGDLIIIDPTCSTAATSGVACTTAGVTTKTNAAHSELLLMWKPVRLQGVGAASSIINANTHPAGKLDGWRQKVDCLFGLTLQGRPIDSGHAYDPTGLTSCPWKTTTGQTLSATNGYFVETTDGTGTMLNAQVDPLPLEAVIGWDATQSGNLAQLLQEPSLMGALEGAGITALGKGVNFPSAPFASSAAGELGGFPTGTTVLTGDVNVNGASTTGDANTLCHMSSTVTTNPFPSNYSCNPSSIDGLTITDSSQGGGGIFVHGWNHNLQIANNRIYSNAGTLSGGINLGQGEFAPSYIQGGTTNAPPGSCVSSGVATNAQLPYCNNLSVNIHNNSISLNSSTGDELFSGTPAGAGGVSVCTGSDYYKFNYNWVCGNLSSGDGGGMGQLGFSYNGDIEHNSILFNQSLNPTIPANGGGLLIMGTPDADPTCGATTDQDCVPTPASITPSDGVGPGLVINANLIMGNAAEAGSGGGLRLQQVNGSDILAFPTQPNMWYAPMVTNNIIADNLAGWDGGGISLVDALNVNIINNTVVSNSTTASAGILFTTIGAPLASSQGTNCVVGTETSCPQVGGLVTIQNSAVMNANLPATVVCPAGHYQAGSTTPSTAAAGTNATCRTFSYPLLENNIFWQNSAYYIGVGAQSAQYQQNVVSLYNAFTTTLAPNQPQAHSTTAHGSGTTITGGTGACMTASYWDIGVRGDVGPGTHDSGVTLAPIYSVLTSTGGYNATNLHNTANNPNFASQYCNGARTPPEFAASGYAVPPGISDATVPNPIFNLTPVATVDEGNNWINLRWGPLSLLNPVTNTVLANYALTTGSAVINSIPTSEPNYATLVPKTDFFGNSRPEAAGDTRLDPGAVEFAVASATATLSVTGGPLSFGNQGVGYSSAAQTLTLHNTGAAAANSIALAFSSPPVFSRPTPSGAAGNPGGTCGATLAAHATCTINVVFTPTAVGAYDGELTITANGAVAGSPVGLSGNGIVAVLSASLTPTSHAYGNATRGVGVLSAPTQTFILTNTGNVTITGVAQGVLGGTNPTEFSVVRLLSTCGPAGNGQFLGQTTLAPGAACAVTVQFRPLTGQTTGAKSATVSVTDLAGTQTSTLTGTAQ
jgi:centrosomal CEP192-like protein